MKLVNFDVVSFVQKDVSKLRSICVVSSCCRTAKELRRPDLLLDLGVLSMEMWRGSSDQKSKPTNLLHTRK